ncbi:MAG: hypothetical protein LBU34_08700 [Planctomycetaceae bacterium]|nr:hypothetical protein [Planctomycetaceae bacterium]
MCITVGGAKRNLRIRTPQHHKAPHGARLSSNTTIISPLQGLYFVWAGSGGCAALHRRLCTSRPAGLGQKNIPLNNYGFLNTENTKEHGNSQNVFAFFRVISASSVFKIPFYVFFNTENTKLH